MKGDGDFRSEECRRIAEEADVIITNPPFSLIRDFFKFLRESEKKFLVIIPLHAVSSQVAFPFLYDDHAWLGVTQPQFFKTPDGCVKKFSNTYWFTNLKNPRRQQPLKLTKVYRGHEADYPTYDNYNAIEVSRVCDIPADYDGLMGVPLSFLHKHDPRQFEILGHTHGRAEYELCAQPVKKYENAVECVSEKVVPPTCSINTGAVFAVDQVPEGRHYYMVPGQEKPLVMPYSRLLIRRRAGG